MRYVRFGYKGRHYLGERVEGGARVLGEMSLESLLHQGVDLETFSPNGGEGAFVAESDMAYLPVLERPAKIFCVGLNYAEHTQESRFEQPAYPTIFARYHTSLVGHGQPIVRPRVSDSLDFEGELAVVLKHGGRHIPRERALACVCGYALFNDASVREYQFLSPQWTMGKNFDATGAFGPELVTASELPDGARGLELQTRLNDELVQCASTDSMIHDVASLIEIISAVVTLEAGDVIVTGTPAGIGWAREPKLLMKHGDVCEVSLTGFQALRNPVRDEC